VLDLVTLYQLGMSWLILNELALMLLIERKARQ
jgi:hypothetical protein